MPTETIVRVVLNSMIRVALNTSSGPPPAVLVLSNVAVTLTCSPTAGEALFTATPARVSDLKLSGSGLETLAPEEIWTVPRRENVRTNERTENML